MTFQIASAEGYGPKEQGGGGAELYTFFPFADWIGMGLFFGLSETLPSDTTGGFAYKGYGTGAIGLFAEVHFRLSSVGTLGTLFGGGRAGLSADWGSYQYTSLYFFYPEEVTEGFLFLRLASLPSLQVRLSLPVRQVAAISRSPAAPPPPPLLPPQSASARTRTRPNPPRARPAQ